MYLGRKRVSENSYKKIEINKKSVFQLNQLKWFWYYDDTMIGVILGRQSLFLEKFWLRFGLAN